MTHKSFRGGGGLAVLLLGLWLLASAAPAQAGKWKDASEKHERDCQTWCSANSECGKCLPLLPCPPGTRKLKSWTGYGKNWHACSRPGLTNSKKHEQDCKKWCKEHEDCGKCNPLPCPPPSKNLKKWTGPGKNWYACKKIVDPNQASRQRHQECKTWCGAEKNCKKCLPALPCPPGMQKLKSFSGPGPGWYACGQKRSWQDDSAAQRKKCLDWCKSNQQCEKCVTSKTACPQGTHVYSSFEGSGQNYYACGRPAVLNTSPSPPRESQRRPGTPEVRFGN
jgi:hypothetical protein